VTTPPSGPASNNPTTCSDPDGWLSGTRTEAEQNVPQAKPDWAELTVFPSAEISFKLQRL
jgi:hypothetical protein